MTQTHQDTAGIYLLIVDAADEGSHDELIRDLAGLCTRLNRDGAYIGLGVLGCGGIVPVPLGAGGRHLTRLEITLAESTAQPGNPINDYQHSRIRRLPLPPGTVVVAFSPLLDASTLSLLGRFAAAGYRVTALATGNPVEIAGATARLEALERRVRLLQLEASGIPVTEYTAATPSLTAAMLRLRGRPAR